MDLTSLIPAQQFRYYYETLSKKEMKVYNTLLSGMLRYAKAIVCHGCTVSQIQKIFRFLKLDVPELFFIKSIGIRYMTIDSLHCAVIPEYRFTICQVRDTLIAMAQNCKDLIDKYKWNEDFEKVKAIHDYIASTVKYKDVDAPYSHEVPGALLFRIGVCEGIAKTFKYLADHLALQSIVVIGVSNQQGRIEGHGWNLAKINGTFYHIDVTFDATISPKNIRYDFFNLSDADMQLSHRWEENLPTCPKTYGI